MRIEDTEAWYRQFWPWFIIALPASAVIAGLFTFWLSMQSADSLVAYSDDGINVVTERNLAAEQKANKLGLTADIAIDPASGAVTVAVRSTDTVKPPQSVSLTLRHVTLSSKDVEVQLFPAMSEDPGETIWAGHLVYVPSGRFQLILSSSQDWRLSAEWQGEKRIVLGVNNR